MVVKALSSPHRGQAGERRAEASMWSALLYGQFATILSSSGKLKKAAADQTQREDPEPSGVTILDAREGRECFCLARPRRKMTPGEPRKKPRK